MKRALTIPSVSTAAVLALLLYCMNCVAEVYRDRFTASFTLETSGTLIGKTDWSLSGDGTHSLVFLSTSKVAGIAALFTSDRIIERSEWRGDGNTLRPHGYRYARTGGKKEKEVALLFDWSERRATNTVKGQTWSIDVPDNALDKLGYIVVMMHDLQQGKRQLVYPIADGGKLKTYEMEITGTEVLNTKLGTLETFRIHRVRDDDKRDTTFWMAPALGYLPVKVEHREKDGTVITLLIESVEGIEPAVSAPFAIRVG